MDLYVIIRRNGWATPQELEAAGERSAAEGDKDGSGVRWIRSYVLAEESGRRARSASTRPRAREAIRAHAEASDLPVDEIVPVADTVIVRARPGARRGLIACARRRSLRAAGGPRLRPWPAQALVGREAERERLEAALGRRAAGAARSCCSPARPGSGKTPARRRSRASREAPVLWGRASQGAATPYGPDRRRPARRICAPTRTASTTAARCGPTSR